MNKYLVYLSADPSVRKVVKAKTWNQARVKANLQKAIHGVQATHIKEDN